MPQDTPETITLIVNYVTSIYDDLIEAIGDDLRDPSADEITDLATLFQETRTLFPNLCTEQQAAFRSALANLVTINTDHIRGIQSTSMQIAVLRALS